MNIYDASEQAYKRGYEQGKKDARKKGRWIEHRNKITGAWHYDCPFCDDGYAMKERDNNPSNFCANCGADMRGEEDDNS